MNATKRLKRSRVKERENRIHQNAVNIKVDGKHTDKRQARLAEVERRRGSAKLTTKNAQPKRGVLSFLKK